MQAASTPTTVLRNLIEDWREIASSLRSQQETSRFAIAVLHASPADVGVHVSAAQAAAI